MLVRAGQATGFRPGYASHWFSPAVLSSFKPIPEDAHRFGFSIAAASVQADIDQVAQVRPLVRLARALTSRTPLTFLPNRAQDLSMTEDEQESWVTGKNLSSQAFVLLCACLSPSRALLVPH